MKLKIFRGTTSKIIRLFIQDTSSSVGAGLTGLAYNTSGLTAYYCREGDATATAITLVAGTVGTWTSGGFVAVDATNLPGIYELCLPNAMLANGNSVVGMLRGATNMAVLPLEIEMDAVNYQSNTGFVASVPAVLGAVGSVTGAVASVTATVSLPANAPSTFLDNITIADVTSDADARSTLPKMLRALFNRHFNKVTATATQMQVYNDANSLVNTMTTSDDSTTATKGKSA